MSDVIDGRSRDGTVVQSVDRAITVLEILAREGGAGVTEVAAEIGVHKSTAFRLVATLEARGLVEQTGERGTYQIGYGLVRIAGTSTARTDLVRTARPWCKRLAAETGETINVAVLRDGTALYVDQIAGTAGLQPHNWVGLGIPLHATSDGKALLATLDRPEVDALLPTLESFTPHTLTRRPALHRALAEVRARGYALTVDELEEGLTALAAPVYDAHGEVVASLSVSGSTYRMDDEAREAIVGPLLEAARETSIALGWAPGEPD